MGPTSLTTVLLAVHAAATTSLAGLVWTVQVVVYPGFREAGPTRTWTAVHGAHTRRMTAVVASPWAVQGLCVLLLLVRRPSPLVVLAAACAAATVAVTALVSVPLHTRLSRGWDADAAERLVRTNWLRTGAWTAGAVCSLVLLAQG